MISLAKLSIRRPKAMLALWLAVAAVLTLIGLGVSSTLSPTITVVPGTESARAQRLAGAQFGPTELVPILLEGPKAQLDRQGPRLVALLAERPNTRVLSAWDAGTASASLRANPGAAMLVVSVDRPERDVVRYDEPQIESLVSRKIATPVRAFITGQPSIDRAEKDASLSNLRHDELIAVGILLVLLLLGLRAPIAALLVTAVGAISVLAGFGEVALLGRLLTLDPVGVAGGTMTGLAFAVGFALLVLDRFHSEELPGGSLRRDSAAAAARELETTGRAVLVAGTALVVALAVVAIIGPTRLMVSVGTGALACAAFATGGAVVVMPAALVLLGKRIDAFGFPAPRPLARLWSSAVAGGNRVVRHAVFAGFAATALLAAVAVPAFALHSGPPDITQLPPGSKARIAFQEVSRVMGPGWATPYNLIVVSNTRPLTTPALLASLDRFELQIAKDTRVEAVTGPGAINSTSSQLSSFGPQLKHSATVSDKSKTQLLQLIDGLGQAGSGSAQLQTGLAQASSGAQQLHGGSGQAQSGAGQLHAGLAHASSGSKQLRAGLNQALDAANQIKSGAGKLLAGSTQITNGLGKAAGPVKAGLPSVRLLAKASASTNTQIGVIGTEAKQAQGELATALATLQAMTTGKNDPNYSAALNQLSQASHATGAVANAATVAASSAGQAAFLAAGVNTQVSKLAPGLDQLYVGSQQLEAGIKQLRDGNTQLATGIGKLANGGTQLSTGLGQLTAGAGALQIGLGQLTTGAGQLATGLAGGVSPAGQLTTGLGTMQAAVIKARGQIPSTAQLHELEQQSPGIFNSGYFVLAAVEGAQPGNRNAATFTINLLRGGTAGQIVVASKYEASDARTAALGTSLAALGQAFGKRSGTQVAVGGPAGDLGDLTSATRSRIWLDVAALALAVALVLALALRAVLLPIVATAFSLLTTAATFGVLTILLGGSTPPLGGPGHLDPITIISVFTIAFAITMAFSTLLLMRVREAYLARAGAKRAVRIGLRETAAASTGAGLVMVAALIPFSTTELLNIRALGIGVAIAILIDVLVVRPVLLPAAVAVLGRFGWWPASPERRGDDGGRPHEAPTAAAPHESPVAP
ncbi:MAG TPA: MMPL family transporter [Solirubrobacteraceae bacterium]|nr:MMPL family transporter [Solirubrobacteraceae bacterium]